MALINKPSHMIWKNFSFVIMDAPTDNNLHLYLKELKKYNVTDVVRVCEKTYSKDAVEATGIKVHELEFPDGEPPSSDIIETWLSLVKNCFKANPEYMDMKTAIPERSIAVHCVAGLGRAPVLVAIALIESGVDAIRAVEEIRLYRRGAINLRQLKYLEKYEPKNKKKDKCCIQ